MPSTTAAGTGLAISAGVPASQSAGGYAALSYTEVGNVEQLGGFGPTTEVTSFQPLKGAQQKHKGPTNFGALNPTIALDDADAGQALLAAAAAPDNRALYAVRVTKPDGSLRYFQVRVFGMPETIGAANSMITAAPVLEINTPVIKVAAGTPAAPVFTTAPSISPTSGAVGTTFTATDGTASNASSYTRRWLLGSTAIGTGPTVTPNAAGSLTLEVTATGAGGSNIATSPAVTVATGSTPTPSPSPMMARLKRANTAALAANPEDQAADATLATLTMGATADSTLTKIHSGVAGSNPAMPSVARFYGGRYALESNNRAIFPVANVAPASGSLSALMPSTPGYSAWGYEEEFVYTGSRLQFRLSGNTARGWRVRVNGKYVSKAAIMNAANSSSNYLTVDFPTSAAKTVTLEGSGSDQIVHIAMAPGDTIAQVASPPEGAISLNTGDSYSEGTGASIPGLFAWVKKAGRRLGETDIRQVAVGSTGYLSNNGGARKTIRQQVADWPVVNSDINMSDVAKVRVAGGYNDYAQPNMATLLQPEVLATLQAIRAMCPNAVIMVYGSHTGSRGPDATTIQVENLIKAAFDQWGDTNSAFIPIATASPPWITGTGNTGAPKGDGTADTLIGPDGSHPNDAGHQVLCDKSVAAERAIYAAA